MMQGVSIAVVWILSTELTMTTRLVLASVVALCVVLLSGPAMIRRLRSLCPERIASDSATLNTLHAAKQGTPAMGGLLIFAGIIAGTLVTAELSQPLLWIHAFVAGGLCLLGLRDDWIKAHTGSKGVTPRQKLLGQCLIGSVAGCLLFAGLRTAEPLHWLIQWTGTDWSLGGLVFIVWSAVVVTVGSNAVNLTDGLDGLASGTVCISLLPMLIWCVLLTHADQTAGGTGGAASGTMATAIVAASLLGATMGFLWFNCHPAQVFLGDTGALPIGGLLSSISLATGGECLLLIAGGVFLVEVLSVVVQVASFRLRGKRVLRCSPLHNHFVFRGDAESRIVCRFWLSGGMFAILAVWWIGVM
jgi:phospho-N-acetylmuramoyl-pentapeptide-transferase